jgi:flagellar hook-associated protein 3 FlgL
MNFRSFLKNVEDIRVRLYKRTLEVSSGKKLRNPSEDPVGSSRVLRIRDSMSRINQYYRNIHHASTHLASTSEALNALQNMIHSVSEKAAYGLNGLHSQESREAIATDLEGLAKNMLRLSEASIDGKRIFSGSQVLTDPYRLEDGAYVYQGDDAELMVEVAEGLKIQTNIPGADVFSGAGSDIINTVMRMAQYLRAGDLDAMGALLSNVNQATRAVDVARTIVGQNMNQLDTTKSRHDQQLFNLTAEIAGIEDADLAESISGMVQNETALRAALNAGARIQQSSLFDILG